MSDHHRDPSECPSWHDGCNCTPETCAEVWRQLDVAEQTIDALRARFTAPIVCICGSTRFKQSWITENARLTREGNIVLAVGLWGHHERQYPDEKTKAMLDDLHKRKIDLCDWVWVLDVGGYIGDSTRSEIEYAERLGRPVRYLSQEFPGYEEPVDPLRERVGELEADLKVAYEVFATEHHGHLDYIWDSECEKYELADRAEQAEARLARLEADLAAAREREDALWRCLEPIVKYDVPGRLMDTSVDARDLPALMRALGVEK